MLLALLGVLLGHVSIALDANILPDHLTLRSILSALAYVLLAFLILDSIGRRQVAPHHLHEWDLLWWVVLAGLDPDLAGEVADGALDNDVAAHLEGLLEGG